MAALERRCFPDPWSLVSFRDALSIQLSFGIVAECDGEIAGYLIGRELSGSGEILNLAVAPEHRRRRIARQLLAAGLEVMAARGADEVFLEVRESNLGAQALYLSAGFRPVGQRVGYYRNPREDALVLRSEIPGAERNG